MDCNYTEHYWSIVKCFFNQRGILHLGRGKFYMGLFCSEKQALWACVNFCCIFYNKYNWDYLLEMKIRHRVAAIIIQANKVLLVKGKGYPELWTPGGKMDEGETEKETLRRELKEEVDLDLQTNTFFKEYFLKSPYNLDYMTKTRCFLAKVKGKPKPGHEIEKVVWYGKEDFENKRYKMLEENEKGLIPDLIKEGLLK